jgi:pimeloyl-ACP methyl ester carboxylesterase
MKYGLDWQPLELRIDAIQKKSSVALATSFAMTTAINEITQQGRTVSKEDQISARTIVLPTYYYGAYEALAARLSAVEAGAELPLYVAPQGELKATVKSVTPEVLNGPNGTTNIRKYELAVPNGGAAGATVTMNVTIDDRARLLRLDLPDANAVVVRDDASSVAMRTAVARNPTDTDVSIPANGFNLAGSLTVPPTVAGRLRHPAVVLVGGPGPLDRDEVVNGVPVFMQVARALAESGHVVLRYDNRGTAQSGGRTEAATLDDYADDLGAVVRWLSKRKDVDPRRIVACGYSEGAAVAMIAASRHKEIDGLVTIGVDADSGADVVLAQQRKALERANLSDADKQAKIELQKKIDAAVLSGTGWEGIADNVRRQADTPLFRSLLAFDPAKVLARTRQPILIVQGEADTQVAPNAADRLGEIARTRKKAPAPEIVRIAGMTHGLTGENERAVSPKIAETIADWIKKI